MSVLIKGMEMPTNCESCPCKTADAFGGLGCQATGYIPLRKANQDRPDWCPLVPVPPHGRLVDAVEREKGKWQITDAYPHNVYCSECHKKFAQTHWAVWEDGSLPRNFCPNCGAKMESEGE